MKINKKTKQKGFTLIELMVAMSIVVLLSSVVLGQVAQARSLARDALRNEMVHQLQNVIEAYRNDNGRLPGTQGVTFFTNEATFCSDISPYADCSIFTDPVLGSYLYMLPISGGYCIGARFEKQPSYASFGMGWLGGYGEPAGTFYFFLVD